MQTTPSGTPSPGCGSASTPAPGSGSAGAACARTSPLGRLAIGALLVCAFAVVASLVDPFRSSADTAPVPAPRGSAARSAGVVARPAGVAPSRPLLGQLVDDRYKVLIYGGAEGPVYTVCTLDGEELARELPADEVYRAFPDLPIDRLRLEPAPGEAGVLMIAPSKD